MAAGINQFSNRRTHNVHTHDGRVHPRTALLLSIGGHTFFHETPPTNPPENLCENFTWSAFWSLQVSFVCPTAPGAGTCCGKRAAPTAPLQLRWSGRAVKWQRLRAVHLKLLDLLHRFKSNQKQPCPQKNPPK